MFELKKLPYEFSALEPYISEETMSFHYGKHHQGYTNNLNKAIEKDNLQDKTIEEILSKVSSYSIAVRNNGGGYWNHNFFWESMTGDHQDITGNILEKIKNDFGSFENFKEEFTKKTLGNFGSGWTWLVENEEGKLEIINTPNQDNPLMDIYFEKNGYKKPLLAIDIWEHAYYVDYRNRRADYLEAFWNVVNWNKVNNRLS